jgi:hypothetical protein
MKFLEYSRCGKKFADRAFETVLFWILDHSVGPMLDILDSLHTPREYPNLNKCVKAFDAAGDLVWQLVCLIAKIILYVPKNIYFGILGFFVFHLTDWCRLKQ